MHPLDPLVDLEGWGDWAADCIRCGEAPRVDDEGYCCHCHWAVKLEVENGLRQIGEYLQAWARFADWYANHEAAWPWP